MPWQRLYSERGDYKNQNAWTVTEYCSLFIGTGRSLWGITSMPLMKVYNIDSDLYGLKGHSIFKSVCNNEASWRGTFGYLTQAASAGSHFFLEDLRRRSIDPTVAPFAVLDCFSWRAWSVKKSLLSFGEPKVQKTPSLSSLPRNDLISQHVAVPPCRVYCLSLRSTAQRAQAGVRLV